MSAIAPPSNTVFIGDLPADVDDATIQRVFGQYGNVTSFRVLSPSGRGSGNAIVSFSSVEEATWLVNNVNGNMPTGIATPVTVMFKSQSSSKGGSKGPQATQAPDPSATIFVGDLPVGIDEATLTRVFASYGHIVSHKVLQATASGTPAIITFNSVDHAKFCVENLNGNIPHGLSTPVKVSYKKAKTAGKGGLPGSDGMNFSTGAYPVTGAVNVGKGGGCCGCMGAGYMKGAGGMCGTGGFQACSAMNPGGAGCLGQQGGMYGGAGFPASGTGVGTSTAGTVQASGAMTATNSAASAEVSSEPSARILVGNLPRGIDGETVSSVFGAYGAIKSVDILPSSTTGSSVIISFETLDDAKWCVGNLNGIIPAGLVEPVTAAYTKVKAPSVDLVASGCAGSGKGSGCQQGSWQQGGMQQGAQRGTQQNIQQGSTKQEAAVRQDEEYQQQGTHGAGGAPASDSGGWGGNGHTDGKRWEDRSQDGGQQKGTDWGDGSWNNRWEDTGYRKWTDDSAGTGKGSSPY
eukprot:TRINITY_DN46975_c0_g1_i1.p1 TRINITY_DN46975_c0_g1~~TRINITY_DN46975_c0_g1_i1.p1  ORF type:complete len:518 (-),score=75.36 TRINITY_DN46975_c0_g1_i1:74-1627(-)